MRPHLYHLHAISALHCGTGQSVGIVDLPIARARATHLPIVPGSSLRGVLREALAETGSDAEPVLFGPRSIAGSDDGYAGALAIGDAHLLMLPVRSLAGIVAYVTCPFVLRHYAQDSARSGVATPDVPAVADEQAIHGSECVNILNTRIVLEDLDLAPDVSPQAGQWAAHVAAALCAGDVQAGKDLMQRFVILSDSVFSYLAETATEVRTRIAIDQATGTVRKGMLWTEENLPAESVLWGVYALSDSRLKGDSRKAGDLAGSVPREALLQLGGKAGVGRGLTRFIGGSAA